MTYLMILEKMPILTNLKKFYYLGMEMNANVMHVKKIISSRSFQFLYYLYLFILQKFFICAIVIFIDKT
jgi:hypothetical protein